MGLAIFTESGTFSPATYGLAAGDLIQVMVIGGGGGGQGKTGAGGGHGSCKTAAYRLPSTANIAVTVGTGGTGGLNSDTASSRAGGNGGSSSFGTAATASGGLSGGNGTAGDTAGGKPYGTHGGGGDGGYCPGTVSFQKGASAFSGSIICVNQVSASATNSSGTELKDANVKITRGGNGGGNPDSGAFPFERSSNVHDSLGGAVPWGGKASLGGGSYGTTSGATGLGGGGGMGYGAGGGGGGSNSSGGRGASGVVIVTW